MEHRGPRRPGCLVVIAATLALALCAGASHAGRWQKVKRAVAVTVIGLAPAIAGANVAAVLSGPVKVAPPAYGRPSARDLAERHDQVEKMKHVFKRASSHERSMILTPKR